MSELVQQLLDLKVRLSRWSKWWLASDLVSNAAFTIQAQQAHIAELEAENQRLLRHLNRMNDIMCDALASTALVGGGEK